MKDVSEDIASFFEAHGITLLSGSVTSFQETMENVSDPTALAQGVIDMAPAHFLSLPYDSLRLDLLPLPCLVVCEDASVFVIQKAGAGWVNLSGRGHSSGKRMRGLDFEMRFKPEQVVVHRGFTPGEFRWVDYVRGYARGNRKRMIMGFGGSMVGHLASLFMPIGALLIIDKVLGHNGVGTLDVIIALLIGAELLRFFMTASKNIILGELADEFVHETQSLLFQSQLNHRNPQLRPTSHDLYRMLKHIEKTRKIFTNYSVALIADLFFLIVLVGVMFLLSPLLAQIAILGLVANILATVTISFMRRNVTKRRMEVSESSDKTYVELLTTGADRRLMGRQHNTLRDWNGNIDANLRFEAQGDEYKYATSPINTLLLNCLRAVIMWFGAIEALNGFITVGQFIAFNLVVALSLGPISKLSSFVADLTEIRRSSKTVKHAFSKQMEQGTTQSYLLPNTKALGALEFKDVDLVIPRKEKTLVAGINLKIESGEKVAIMGSSGVGKSTLLSALLGDQRCYSGQILLDGKDLQDVSLSAYRRRIGVVAQGANLIDGTVLANLQLGDTDYNPSKVEAALKSAQIYDRIMSLDNGLDEQILTKHSTLSQGEKQRLLLARAFLHGTDMLVLDEPTSALDEENEKRVSEAILNDFPDRTLIVSTHSLSLAEKFDWVYLIRNSELVVFRGEDVRAGGLSLDLKHPGKPVLLHDARATGARKDGQ